LAAALKKAKLPVKHASVQYITVLKEAADGKPVKAVLHFRSKKDATACKKA
jgi:hypothetical protein